MIDFYTIPGKNIIKRIFYLFIKLIPGNTILYILQGPLKGKRWTIGSGEPGYWLGIYEYKKQLIFSKIIKEGSIVYDIGAHLGLYTILASKLVGVNGKVFAFEPSPKNIYYLRNHLRLNYCDNVTVIAAAVADKNDISFFEENTVSSTSHLSIKGNLRVMTINLDNLVSKGKIPPPDYIKIDAQGAELSILFGAKNILIKHSPTIILSTHGSDLHSQCYTFLKSINYDFQSIDKNEDINNTSELLACKRK